MRISVDRKELVKIMGAVKGFAPTGGGHKPILRNVKIEAGKDGATLTATDLESGIRHAIEFVDVLTPGAALLPAAQFGALLRGSTDQTLHIECGETGVNIRGERSTMQLPGDEPADFPTAVNDSPTDVDCIELPAESFAALIARTIFACDTESSRYALGGVKLELAGDTLTAIATDGRRLAVFSTAVAIHGRPIFALPDDSAQTNVIVPLAALKRIIRALPKRGPVKLGFHGDSLFVHTPIAAMSTRCSCGRFPEWRKVFPVGFGETVDLPVGPLRAALKHVAAATSGERRGVVFAFSLDSLTLSAKSADTGEAKTEMPIAFRGKAMAITLDPRFVGDFLSVLDGAGACTVELKESNCAVLFSAGPNYRYVVMPPARDR